MFGRLVKEKRSAKGYSLQKVCNLCSVDVSPSYLYLIEEGKRKNPSFCICVELCKVLEIDIRDLFVAFNYEEIYNQFIEGELAKYNNRDTF